MAPLLFSDPLFLLLVPSMLTLFLGFSLFLIGPLFFPALGSGAMVFRSSGLSPGEFLMWAFLLAERDLKVFHASRGVCSLLLMRYLNRRATPLSASGTSLLLMHRRTFPFLR